MERGTEAEASRGQGGPRRCLQCKGRLVPGCAGGSQSRRCEGYGQAGLRDVPGTRYGDRVKERTGTALARREEGDVVHERKRARRTGFGTKTRQPNPYGQGKQGKAHFLEGTAA